MALQGLVPNPLCVLSWREGGREGREKALSMAHLYFMILQHDCFRLVVEPKSKSGFVTETLRVSHLLSAGLGTSL